MKLLILTNTIEIEAPITEVWDVLTNPQKTAIYMYGCKAVSNWQIGSDLFWQANHEGKDMVFVKGKIVDIKAPHLLIYSTFDPNSSIEDIPANYLHVTYTLTAENEKTILTVSQGDYATVAEGERRYQEGLNNGQGWNPILLEIKKLAQSFTDQAI